MTDTPAPGTVMRMWTGWIRPADRDAYAAYIEETGLSSYRSTPGNLGAFTVFRDVSDGQTEVRTISFWQSRDDIRAFAGNDIARAVFYAEDDRYLVDRETTVQHFDVA